MIFAIAGRLWRSGCGVSAIASGLRRSRCGVSAIAGGLRRFRCGAPSLTFTGRVVVDFAHQPTYQPVAKPGLAFVGMSRCTDFALQAFRNLPGFWEFRKVVDEDLFRWRDNFEQRMDAAHDACMEALHAKPWLLEDDLAAHLAWSKAKRRREATKAEMEDLEKMLGVRGLLAIPEYADAPTSGPRGLQGGGGRKRGMGMPAPAAPKKQRTSNTVSGFDSAATEPPAKKPRVSASTVSGDDEHNEHSATMQSLESEPAVPTGRVGASLTQELAGRTQASGWHCSLLGRELGRPVPAPAWYMRAESGASQGGTQLASTCGLHAVNHCLAALGPQKLFTWAAFDARALPGERCPQTGDWEFAALQRNIEAADAGMTPIQGNEHEDLVSWLGDASRLSLWRPDVLGCLVHVPGHWVALTRPSGQHSEQNAALMCDSLKRQPFALSADDVGLLFAHIAIFHQTARSEQEAATWSLYLVTH